MNDQAREWRLTYMSLAMDEEPTDDWVLSGIDKTVFTFKF